MLAEFLNAAVRESADALEFEYQGGKLHVMAFHGTLGVGIGSVTSNSKDCKQLIDEIVAFKRRKRIEVGDKTIGIAVSTYDSFGETAWRIQLSQIG